MYAKLENGRLIPAPKMIDVGDNHVWNPTPAQLEEAGYKLVVFTDPPETEPGYHAEPGWEETAKRITQTWTVVEDPPETDIPDEEALAILMGVGK